MEGRSLPSVLRPSVQCKYFTPFTTLLLHTPSSSPILITHIISAIGSCAAVVVMESLSFSTAQQICHRKSHSHRRRPSPLSVRLSGDLHARRESRRFGDGKGDDGDNGDDDGLFSWSSSERPKASDGRGTTTGAGERSWEAVMRALSRPVS